MRRRMGYATGFVLLCGAIASGCVKADVQQQFIAHQRALTAAPTGPSAVGLPPRRGDEVGVRAGMSLGTALVDYERVRNGGSLGNVVVDKAGRLHVSVLAAQTLELTFSSSFQVGALASKAPGENSLFDRDVTWTPSFAGRWWVMRGERMALALYGELGMSWSPLARRVGYSRTWTTEGGAGPIDESGSFADQGVSFYPLGKAGTMLSIEGEYFGLVVGALAMNQPYIPSVVQVNAYCEETYDIEGCGRPALDSFMGVRHALVALPFVAPVMRIGGWEIIAQVALPVSYPVAIRYNTPVVGELTVQHTW